MKLSNLEKETIILFNEAESTAEIETFDVRLLGQLRKVAECDGVNRIIDKNGYGIYVLPKALISITSPQICSVAAENTFCG